MSARILVYPGAFCCLLFPQPGLVLAFGLLLFALELICFVQQADRSLDMRVLLRLLALLFMWVTPALSYLFETASWYMGYQMAVKPDFYFALVIPCTVAFNLSLSLPLGQARILPSSTDALTGWALLGFGLVIQQITPYVSVPIGMQFFVFLCGQLWLVGLLFVQQASPKLRWYLLGFGATYLFYEALQQTLFGYAIIWIVILLCFTLKTNEISQKIRWVSVGVIGILILFLLSFKYEYRQQVWFENTQTSKAQIFMQMLGQRLLHPVDLVKPEIIQHYIDRLNQGYHTAKAMAYTPVYEPFTQGATLMQGFRAALLPRLLDPNKPQSGGKENIRRFSGINNQPWSSNIGQYGEAYVNFGIAGAWLVMLFYGLLISGILWVLQRYFPIPWWPFILEPVLNVEKDIGMSMNHLCKSMMFMVVVVMVCRVVAPPAPPEGG